MIVFKNLRYKNFLSTGNDFTELELNKSPLTLVVGENGAGKTSGCDALFYALFGKAYRNINLPQLVNSITNKGLLVEVEFDIGSNEYLVRRGIKPNIFEIYQNGNLIDQDADTKEYQKFLEKQILKMNSKSFGQIVFLGSSNYVPFMKLSAADRRSVVEDLLDLQVFSLMSAVLKTKIDQAKKEYEDLEHSIEINQQRIELLNRNIETLRKNNDEIIRTKESQIKEIEKKLSQLEEENSQYQAEIVQLEREIEGSEKLKKRLRKLDDYESELNLKIKQITKDLSFFVDNSSCPTCKQEISDDFRKERVENRSRKLESLEDGLTKLKEEYTETTSKLSEFAVVNKKITKCNEFVSSNLSEIRSQTNLIQSLQRDISSLNDETGDIQKLNDDLETANHTLESNIESKFSLKEDLQVMEVAGKMLKDSGIKSRIIAQYVPIINTIVNHYLSQLDFFVQFELDEKFNETIKSRYRDIFSYGSFSEGEKTRIDLALMLTWREIAKRRNSAATNLLIMDEILDSSMSQAGKDDLLEIIEKFDENTNVFVISHSEMMQDRIENTIKFEKVKNFSRIVE